MGGQPDGDLLQGGGLPHQVGRQRPREEHRVVGGLRHTAQQGQAAPGPGEDDDVLGVAGPVHGEQQAPPQVLKRRIAGPVHKELCLLYIIAIHLFACFLENLSKISLSWKE